MNAISPPWPSGFEEISCRLKETAQQSESKAIFLNRVMKAAIAYAEKTSVVEAASASSDYEVLLSVLESPEGLDLLRLNDPLIDARLRGLEVKQQLLEAEGGCYKGNEVAKILGITRQAVDKRRKEGKLIGISRGKHKYLYPAWQFTDTGTTLDGLEDVLVELKDFDPWMQLAFMLNPHSRLQEKTPLEALRKEQINQVLTAARTFGEHGAN